MMHEDKENAAGIHLPHLPLLIPPLPLLLHPTPPILLFFFFLPTSLFISIGQNINMSKIVKPGRQTARPTSSGDRHSSAIPSAQETHSNHQQIRDFINKLTEIYDNVEDIISPVLNPSEYADLSINCQELKLDSNGLYTNPSPQPYFFNASSPNVTNHPIDLEKNGGKYRVAYNAFGNSLQHYMLSPFAAYPSAQHLCDELDWQFRVYPRKGIEDNLAGKTNWRQSEYVRKIHVHIHG